MTSFANPSLELSQTLFEFSTGFIAYLTSRLYEKQENEENRIPLKYSYLYISNLDHQ